MYKVSVKNIAGVFVAFGLVACTSSEGWNSSNDMTEKTQPLANEYENRTLRVEENSLQYVRHGRFESVEKLSSIAQGVSRVAVEKTLGLPKNTREDNSWFYDINLPLESNNHIVCQYRVMFENDVVVSQDWRRPQCRASYEKSNNI